MATAWYDGMCLGSAVETATEQGHRPATDFTTGRLEALPRQERFRSGGLFFYGGWTASCGGRTTMQTVSLNEIEDHLETASKELLAAGAIENAKQGEAEDYIAIADLCGDIERQASYVGRVAIKHRRNSLGPATVGQMAGFIAKKIDNTELAMKNIPGGERAAALRNAEGKCEMCGYEFHLTPHHIIPRDEGGLDDAENLMMLCKTCHNAAEGTEYRTRRDILRHVERSVRINAKPAKNTDDERTRSEKAAATRAMNEADKRREEMELAEWDRWSGMFSKCVMYLTANDPKPPRPEKLWHVTVYGAGPHSNVGRERD